MKPGCGCGCGKRVQGAEVDSVDVDDEQAHLVNNLDSREE